MNLKKPERVRPESYLAKKDKFQPTFLDDTPGQDSPLEFSSEAALEKISDAIETNPEKELRADIGRFSKNPLGFVKYSFPWGAAGGELEKFEGPDEWQKEILIDLGKGLLTINDAIREAVASGHGIGKSALVSWIILWGMSTFEDCKIIVTANTEMQLKTKTWAELAKWYRLCITKHWFVFTATALYSSDVKHEKTWRCDMVPWSEHKTEAFAGMHNQGKRIVVIFDEACHDDQTEVLTERGWKFFKDLSGQEALLTMDPASGIAEYLRPSALHTSHKTGEMIKYRIRGSSFLVTPNHRMLVTSQKGKTSFRPAGDLAQTKNLEVKIPRSFKWLAPDQTHIRIPALTTTRKVYPELILNTDAFVELLGWYGSEGHLVYSSGLYRSVGFTQKDTRHIETLCNKLGFNPKVYKKCSTPQVYIHNTQLAQWLSQFGVGCKVKRIPGIIRTLSTRQINIFLNAYRDGDGYKKSLGRDIFYTSSEKTADDLQELCFLAGQQSSKTKRALAGKDIHFKSHDAVSSVDGFVVSRTWSDTELHLKTKHLERVSYDGMVYCATLPKYGVLFTRRDGVCMWSGNSAIPDKIWEVTEGALTDSNTEIIWAVFGNPTRNTGRFHDCFGQFRHRWLHRHIDSRAVAITNKKQIQEWVEDFGEDSDFVRVRVRGVFPRTSDHQFISTAIVEAASHRKVVESQYTFAAKILTLDNAWTGGDEIVMAVRQGLASRIVATFRKNDDDMYIAGQLARIEDEEQADAVFIDLGYGTGVYSAGKQMKRDWTLIAFGGASSDPGFVNKRAEMWNLMRKWMLEGGVIPNDPILCADLVGPEAYVVATGPNAGKIYLESKKDMKDRGLPSPNRADAIALSFALPVKPKDKFAQYRKDTSKEYDPYKAPIVANTREYDPYLTEKK